MSGTATFVANSQPAYGARPAFQVARILIPTDFSACSDNALEYAVPVAQLYGSSLFILHALQPEPLPAASAEYAYDRSEVDGREAERQFEALAHSNRLAHIPHQTMIETGGVADAVVDMVGKHSIDLVVLATSGRGGVGKLVIGSVAEEVVRRVGCAVLTVSRRVAKPPQSFPFRRVMFATDYSAGSLQAFSWVRSFAEMQNSQVILLHVLTHGGVRATDAHRLISESVQRLRNTFARILPGPEPIVISEFGATAEVILRLAARHEADLVVMGARATESIGTATHLPFSVAHRVVHEAHCPVLTVRN